MDKENFIEEARQLVSKEASKSKQIKNITELQMKLCVLAVSLEFDNTIGEAQNLVLKSGKFVKNIVKEGTAPLFKPLIESKTPVEFTAISDKFLENFMNEAIYEINLRIWQPKF